MNTGKKPNILFLLTDDQGAWAMNCAGNKDVRTPNLDRIAREGILFNHFFCASPVCSPARASILTGTIPSCHGVQDWLSGGNLFAEMKQIQGHPGYEKETIPFQYIRHLTAYTDLLQENGYHCALSGKWHLGDSMTPQHGFSEWYTIGRGGCEYFHPDIVENGNLEFKDGYVTDLIGENARNTIRKLAGKAAPFYLSVHFTAPHSPWDEKSHPEKYLDMYRDCSFEATPDLPIHPNQVKTCPYGTGERRKELLRGYYAAITAMDYQVGLMLELLDELGIREDTLIMFTSDNGMNLGHHGIWGKGNGTYPQNMYDTSVKVPFLASWKGHIPENQVCEAMCSHYDIFPTLQELLQLSGDVRQKLPGRSFLNWLEHPNGTDERSIVIVDEYGPVRMVRNRDWKLVQRYPEGPNELYHISEDTEEECNLYGNPRYESLALDMRKQLEHIFAEYGDSELDGTKEAVYGTGQFGPVGKFAVSTQRFAGKADKAD